ncbi:MAG: penicillin-binding protein 2 [Flavobacteriales bacterium]|nr:penicillin-binding protein 2 [Flavobacteriales bacterium]
MNPFENRKFILLAIFLLTGLIFIIRLFAIQVLDDKYQLSAANQALRYVTQYPVRGLIYDRHNELLVYNEAAYDLMVVPRQVKALDTAGFSALIGIPPKELGERLKAARKYSRYKASVVEKLIPADQWAGIAEQLFLYAGFYGVKRTIRRYPASVAAHVLGYIGEVGPGDLLKDGSYHQGDYTGKLGLEKEYEQDLRGRRGTRVMLVDVHGREQGSYQNGEYDTLPESGKHLVTTLDRDLQAYGEQLLQNKRGSIVAIEPATGEILAMVSSPGFDPNILAGRRRTENYKMLASNDSLNPLFNRAINAVYRPGSIFKLVQSLVALEAGVITPETRFVCNRGIIGCHGAHSNDALVEAIQHSCNPYFWNVYRRFIQQGKSTSLFTDASLGLTQWHKAVGAFGFGSRLATDVPGINKGLLPDTAFYNRWYGRGRWAFSTIYSNSIGEGEIGVVPLQMANFVAAIANRGYYYTPHLVKSIGDSQIVRKEFSVKHQTGVAHQHFETVIEAMYRVVNEPGGTARRGRIDSIDVCGKTGTVQNEPMPDHSVFVAFAPRQNPKIAISVYVEYSDFGGLWAAPIASLMMERYLTGTVKQIEKEKRILEASFLKIHAKKK